MRVRLTKRMRPLAGPVLEAGSVVEAEEVHGETLRLSRTRAGIRGGYLVLTPDAWEPAIEDEDLERLLSADDT